MPINDYLRDLEKVLEGKDERDPWPTRKDLDPRRTYIDLESCFAAQSLLRLHRYCLIIGAERRGKTTLARYIGLQHLMDGDHVRRLDVTRLSDVNDLTAFTDLLLNGFYDRPDNLFVIEDCHIGMDIPQNLLKAIEDCKQARFLLTARTARRGHDESVDDVFADSQLWEMNWIVRLDATEAEIGRNIKGIVEKAIQTRSTDPRSKSAAAMPKPDDYKYLLEQTAGNKRILNYYLDAWYSQDNPDVPLRDISQSLVLDRFYLERLRGLRPVQRDLLKRMSVLGQFEIPILLQPLFPSNFLDAAREVASLGGLVFSIPSDRFLLSDVESRLTLNYLLDHKAIDSSFVTQVLIGYVKETPNYSDVFHSLRREQERDLLIALARDLEVFQSLTRRLAATQTPISDIVCVLSAIAWADSADGSRLWREYKTSLGDQFKGQIQSKLSKANDIRLVGQLLASLARIDRDNEAVPMANALPVELIASQARSDTVPPLHLYNLLVRLQALSPEKTREILIALDESDYVRLGKKARLVSFQPAMWFLRLLVSDQKLTEFASCFLEGFGDNELVGQIRASPLTVVNLAIRQLQVLAPEKAIGILSSLDEADYVNLGCRARDAGLQATVWFLRVLLRDKQLRKYIDPFLNAIGKEELLTMAQASPITVVKHFRALLRKSNTATAVELRYAIRSRIPDDEWQQKWSAQTLSSQIASLRGPICSFDPGGRQQGKDLVRRLATLDIPLDSGDKHAVSPERLSSLLFSASILDQAAAEALALKAVHTFDPSSMTYNLKGLVSLLWASRRCNPGASRELVEKISKGDPKLLLSRGDPNSISQLLWEAVLSNESRTRDWVAEVGDRYWQELSTTASRPDAFLLLQVLWHANSDLATALSYAVAQSLTSVPDMMDDQQAIPLLGFLAFCGLQPETLVRFPSTENLSALNIYPAQARLLCSLFYLQHSQPHITPTFVKAMLALQEASPQIAITLAEHPLPLTQQGLADILVTMRHDNTTQQEDVYDRLPLLFRTMTRTAIRQDILFSEMCSPDFAPRRQVTPEPDAPAVQDNSRTLQWATIRLSTAIDKRIFTLRGSEHPTGPWSTRFLTLNHGNRQAGHALRMTTSLLGALRKAQRPNNWASYNAWAAALQTDPESNSPPLQQLRYWRTILIRMRMVNVHYQEVNPGAWIIVFRINDTHPFVKQLATSHLSG